MGLVGGILLGVGSLICIVFSIIAMMNVFKAYDKPAWMVFVPILNALVWCEITLGAKWKIVFLFIPFVNIVMMFKMYINLAHDFDKSAGFGV